MSTPPPPCSTHPHTHSHIHTHACTFVHTCTHPCICIHHKLHVSPHMNGCTFVYMCGKELIQGQNFLFSHKKRGLTVIRVQQMHIDMQNRMREKDRKTKMSRQSQQKSVQQCEIMNLQMQRYVPTFQEFEKVRPRMHTRDWKESFLLSFQYVPYK